MSVHMVRVITESPNGDAQNAIDNWVQNHTEWENDPIDHSMVETSAGIDGDGTTYARGDYRFRQTEPADELLSDLEDRLQKFQGGLWYRLGYHECEHDENNPGSCEWEDTRESGDIPDDIPVIE